MSKLIRSFLYSKQFFGFLALIALLDLATDVTEHLHPHYWEIANGVSIAIDCLLLILSGWMFVDLHLRRPR